MINAIWAMDSNWLIGKDNELPWHYKEDLEYFKKITLGKTVVMGRKTFESIVNMIGKPLPGRKNVVVSRGDFQYEGVEVVKDINKYLNETNEDLFIIGGKEIYALTLNKVDKLYITHIGKEFEGNVYFPKFDLDNEFKLVSSNISGDLNFAVYERK